MAAILNPYLNFRGDARDALEFYRDVLGGELSLMTFGEMGDPYPGWTDKIMHGQIDTDSKFTLMASDVPESMGYTVGENTFSVSLSGAKADETELRGYWDKLAQGGTISQPLVASPWGAQFGMLKDKFGITWLVNISGE